MGVSKNRGTPKSSILIGFSLINYPFWGFTPIFGNTHIPPDLSEIPGSSGRPNPQDENHLRSFADRLCKEEARSEMIWIGPHKPLLDACWMLVEISSYAFGCHKMIWVLWILDPKILRGTVFEMVTFLKISHPYINHKQFGSFSLPFPHFQETSRWEKRGALLRTKRKLKAISAMRNGRKLAVPGGAAVAGGSQGSTESTFERQQSSNSKSSESWIGTVWW